MTKKMMVGPKLKTVATHLGYSQKDISEAVGISPVQLSRFFNGASDLNLENFVTLLKFFNIDIEKSVMTQTKIALGMEQSMPDDLNECVVSLFESLDPLGKQTFLKTLVWANSMVDAKGTPKHIVDRVESTLNLI